MSLIGLHKLANVISGITEKPLYITSSSLARQYVTNEGIFFAFVLWPGELVLGPFCFSYSYPLKWTGIERKNKVIFFEAFW